MVAPAREDATDVVEAAGRFRIYLGAAAGVGKTYAMLNEGRRCRARGADVAVGFVECHGRQHTEGLLDGLEIIPRQLVEYRGSPARGDGPGRGAAPAPGDRPRRRACPHERARSGPQ